MMLSEGRLHLHLIIKILINIFNEQIIEKGEIQEIKILRGDDFRKLQFMMEKYSSEIFGFRKIVI
jgi:hypothetical protein